MHGNRRIRVGLALGPRRVVAVTVRRTLRGLRPDRVHRRSLERRPGADGWPELEEALAGLREALSEDGRRPPRLHLALLPPLSRTKVVTMPSAGREALRRLAGREAARHFLDPPAEPVADAAPVARSPLARGARTCVTCCADESVVRTLLAAVGEAGAETGLVAPAAWSLAEGAVALDPGNRRGERRLRLEGPGGRREVVLEDGVLTGVRPGPPPGSDTVEPQDGDAGGDAPAGDRHGRDGGAALDALDAPALAAFGALVAPEDGPALLPEDGWRAWRRRGRVRAWLVTATAVLLAATGALLHLWGLDREIRAVEERRSALSEPAERTSATREAALRLREVVSTVDSVRPRGPGWVRILSEVADRLPASAHLEALEGTDRGVRIAGSARSPSALVPRLEGSPVVESARLESATRASGRRGGESFRIVLTLARPPGSGGSGPDHGPAGPDALAPGSEAAGERPRSVEGP